MTKKRTTGRRPSSTPTPIHETTRAERYRRGKALRDRVPRSSHAGWSPPKDRPDPIDLLIETGRTRVASLLPIRYGRMETSPFAFLRGAAMVMARDLSGSPTTGLHVQMAGDAHVNNFGLFATPERDLVFDTNDFDETLPGPWEYDVKRLATSLVLVSRLRGFPGRMGRKAARTAVGAYRERMHALARMRFLDIWYSHLDLQDVERQVAREGSKLMGKEAEQAKHRTGFHAFPKWAREQGGRYRIRELRPFISHYDDPHDEQAVRAVFERYRATLPAERRMVFDRYQLEDVARKVVGVGSVGTRCSVGLFMGDKDVLDPLFLQVKEADASAYEPYLGRSGYSNHAERVVVGQRLVQQASDVFLNWSTSGTNDFYVRQLRDMKFSSDITVLGPKMLLGQAELCGAALARAHARTGDPAAISGYLGTGEAFDVAVARFAESYADQSASDHALLVQAVRKGRLPARAVE